MIYVYYFIKCVVRWSENSERFEKSYGNWPPDGPNSEILAHSVRYGMYAFAEIFTFRGPTSPMEKKKKIWVCLLFMQMPCLKFQDLISKHIVDRQTGPNQYVSTSLHDKQKFTFYNQV